MNPLVNQIGQNSRLGGLSQLQNVISLLKSKNPNEVAINLMKTNPQFKAFYDSNKNKSVEQICNENGIDAGLVRDLLK